MSAKDAKHLKASPLLWQTLHDFRQSIIEKWIDCNEAGVREKQHAAIKCIDEFAETLSDRIKHELDEAGEGPAE